MGLRNSVDTVILSPTFEKTPGRLPRDWPKRNSCRACSVMLVMKGYETASPGGVGRVEVPPDSGVGADTTSPVTGIVSSAMNTSNHLALTQPESPRGVIT